MKSPLILFVTEEGKKIAERLTPLWGIIPQRYNSSAIKQAFDEKRPLIFIGACGIIVRAVSAYLIHKSKDPPVVVIDERGKFVISLLSGHLGGANELTREIASFLGATPVITTASDIRGLLALDLWLLQRNVVIEDWKSLKELQSKLLETGKLSVFLEDPLAFSLPQALKETSDPSEADFILTYRPSSYPKLSFIVKALCLGVGFHKEEKELYKKVTRLLQEKGFSPKAIKRIATLDSRSQTPAFYKLAKVFDAEALSFTKEELSLLSPPTPSYAQKALKIPGVAEPCALCAAEGGPLLLTKVSFQNITLAVAIHASFTFR